MFEFPRNGILLRARLLFFQANGDVTRDDSQRQFLAQHSVSALLHVVSHCYNVVPTLHRRVALNIVVANRPARCRRRRCCLISLLSCSYEYGGSI